MAAAVGSVGLGKRTSGEAELADQTVIMRELLEESREKRVREAETSTRERDSMEYLRAAGEAEREQNWSRVVYCMTKVIDARETSSLGAGHHVDISLANLYYGRGVALIQLSRFHEAIVDFKVAIAKDPSNAGAFLQRGFAYRKLLCPQLALEDFREALKSLRERRLAQVMIDFEEGRFADVIEQTDDVRFLVQAGKEHGVAVLAELCLTRSIAQSETEKYDDALITLTYGINEARKVYPNDEILSQMKLLRAYVYRAQEEEDEAVRAFTEVKSRYYPSFPETFMEVDNPLANSLRDLLMPHAERRQAALQSLATIYREGGEGMAPSEARAEQIYCLAFERPWLEVELVRAKKWLHCKDYETAAIHLKNVVNSAGHLDRAEAAYELGVLYREGKLLDSCMPAFCARQQFLVAIESEHPHAMVALGHMYKNGEIHHDGIACRGTRTERDRDVTLELFEKAYNQGTDDGSFAYELGCRLYEGEVALDYERAFALFKEAEENGFRSPYLYERLSTMSYHGQGIAKPDFREALRYAKLWRDASPDHGKAHFYLGLVRSLQSVTRNYGRSSVHLQHPSLATSGIAQALLRSVYKFSGHGDDAADVNEGLDGKEVALFTSVAGNPAGKLALAFVRDDIAILKSGIVAANDTITWKSETYLGSGFERIRVAMNAASAVVLTKQADDVLYYGVTKVNQNGALKAVEVRWRQYAYGLEPDITMSGQKVVTISCTEDSEVVCRVATLRRNSLAFSDSYAVAENDYDQPAIALHGKKVVIVLHHTENDTLHYRIGNVVRRTLTWTTPLRVVPGSRWVNLPQIAFHKPNRVVLVVASESDGIVKRRFADLKRGGAEVTWGDKWIAYDMGTAPAMAFSRERSIEYHQFGFSKEDPTVCRGMLQI